MSTQTTCDQCGEVNPADIHTCTPPAAQPKQKCWLCGDMDPAFQARCNVPACGMKDQAAPVQPVASLKEADVLMIAEAHGIDPCTKGLYGFYIDCISSQPAAQPTAEESLAVQPAPVQEPFHVISHDCAERGCMAHDDRIDGPGVVIGQRQWAEMIRGVRVEGDTVVIAVKGGNENARLLCGELLREKNA